MKYIIKKSKFIILFSFIISICILLLAATFVSAYQDANKSFNYLSNNYCEISFSSNQDNYLSMSEFINKLSKYKSDFTLLKENDTKIYGIYTNDSNFSPNIIEGRNLNETDFVPNCKNIIINESLKDKCFYEDNEMLYIFNATVFRVVGVFEDDNDINGNALAYYNLLNKNNSDDYIFGHYYVDFGKNTESILSDLCNDINIDVVRQNNNASLSEKLILLLSSQQTTLSSFILIIIMAFLNSIGMIINWVDSRKDEIKSKFICGALKSEIVGEFVLQFYEITIISFLFVCVLTVPFICVFKSVSVAMISMVSSLVFVLLLSVISVILLSFALNNEFPKREGQRI